MITKNNWITTNIVPFEHIGLNWQTYKNLLFNLEERDKIKPEWSKNNKNKLSKINSRNLKPTITGVVYNINQIRNFFEKNKC